LSLWRVFEHYVDSSIVQCYGRINSCEKKLKIPQEFSRNQKKSISIGHFVLDLIALTLCIIISLAFFSRDLFLQIFYPNLFFVTLFLFFLTVLAIFYFIDKKNETFFNRNSDKKDASHLIIFIPYVILICGAVLGIILGFFLVDFIKPDNQKLDDCFDVLHKTITQKIGENEIKKVVNKSPFLQNDTERLVIISGSLVNNFTDPNWADQQNNETFCYYPNENISFNYCLLKIEISKKLNEQPYRNKAYMFDKKGHVRQYWKESLGGIMLRTDPFWIAYQKTGECQELSILFNETANQSGFESRIIRSDGNGHFWNEVKINGTWKFFDLQQFGGLDDRSNISQYFGEPVDYANTANWKLCDMINKGKKPGIFVYDLNTDGYGENRNDFYDPNHICRSILSDNST
jgi:hypothetical protein